MNKILKAIRIITVAPIMAFGALSVLFCIDSGRFGNFKFYLMSLLFLTVLPLLAYPLQPFIPKFKNKGREGQRNLAIAMAVLGYILSIISALALKAPRTIWIIYLVYLISGLLMVLFNKVLNIRASGHACGVAGPISLLIYFIGFKGIWASLLLPIVYIASIKTGRHKLSELICGSILPVIALSISVIIVK